MKGTRLARPFVSEPLLLLHASIYCLMRTPNVWVCSTKVRFKSCGRATPLHAVNAKLAKLAAVLFCKGDPIRAYFPAQVRLISYGQSGRLGTTQGFSEGRYRIGGGRGGKGSQRGSAAKRGHLITRRMGIPCVWDPAADCKAGPLSTGVGDGKAAITELW